jgi:hypothetical protein
LIFLFLHLQRKKGFQEANVYFCSTKTFGGLDHSKDLKSFQETKLLFCSFRFAQDNNQHFSLFCLKLRQQKRTSASILFVQETCKCRFARNILQHTGSGINVFLW